MKRNAFTLIELLVVIAIIAILAAILFPVFAQARDAARKTACLSNTKQIGLGIMMYVQDYDEMFPGQAWNGAPIGTTDNDSHAANYYSIATWIWSVLPYVKNRQVFVCPSDPNPKHWGTGYDVNPANIGACADGWTIPTPISYAVNDLIMGFGWTPGGVPDPCGSGDGSWLVGSGLEIRSLASIPTPAATYLYGESGVMYLESGWVNNVRAANYTRIYNSKAPYGGAYIDDSNATWAARRQSDAVYRHQRGTTLAYCDGHAKWHNGNQIWSGNFWYDGPHVYAQRFVSPEGICPREYPGTRDDDFSMCD